MVSLETLLGTKVKIVTILDSEIVGKVYAFDVASSTLTVVDETTGHYRIVKTFFIKNVVQLKKRPQRKDKASSGSATEPQVAYVDVKALQATEAELGRQMENACVQNRRESWISNNLKYIRAENGKEVYRKLVKLFPIDEVVVQNESIVIFGNIRVGKPYTGVELLNSSGESSLEFIKSIVEDVNAKRTSAK